MATKEQKPTSGDVSIRSMFMKGEQAMREGKGTATDGMTELVPPQDLKTSPFQRRAQNAARVRRLADQIRATGLGQPVMARRLPDGTLELVYGHGRRDAFVLLQSEATTDAERAKWARIPCIVRSNVSDVESASLGAAENLAREDLTVVEHAQSLLAVKEAGAFATYDAVAEHMGLGKSKVVKLLQLAESPAFIQRAVSPGVKVKRVSTDGVETEEVHALPYTVALEARRFYSRILKATDEKVATRRTESLLFRAAKGDWSRERVEAEIAKLLKGRADAVDEVDESAASAAAAADATPEESQKTTRKVVFQDQGGRWLIYPQNIGTATPEELSTLSAKLKDLLAQMAQKGAA